MAESELLFPKLVVFGASGQTGHEVVEQALAKGHSVTAVVRSPEKFNIEHENLEVVKGDVFDTDAIAPILEGKNAVMSCLGFGVTVVTTHYSESITSIMTAAERAGIARLVCITSSLTQKQPSNSFFLDWILKPIIQRTSFMQDQMLMEDIIMKSNLCYTIVRPPFLTLGPLTENYVLYEGAPQSSSSFSRADLAHFMLKSLQANEWDNKGVGIKSP